MNELGEIESYIENTYFDIIEKYNTVNTGLRIDTWHVSDFTSPCLRKSYYTHTEPKPPFDKTKGKILWMGNVIHEHVLLSQINELTMCYDIEKNKSFQPKDVMNMSKNESKNIITGSLDDLILHNGEFIIGDKKTWNARGWDKQKPDENYVLQLNIYRVLLKESLGIDATSGCLLYLDKSNDLEPKPMAFRLQDIDKTKEYMRETLKVLQQDKGPDANPCWLCKGENKMGKIYCDYWEKCNSETNRQELINLSKKLQDYSEEKKTKELINNIKFSTKMEDFITKN
jgi:hypothetical protein